MANLEAKKLSVDKKQELYESTDRNLSDLKKEVMKSEEVISEKDLEKFSENFYSDIEKHIDRCRDMGLNMTQEEEMIVKNAVTLLMLQAKNNPSQYLERAKDESGRKYVFKKDAYERFFNDMQRRVREVFVKYEIG